VQFAKDVAIVVIVSIAAPVFATWLGQAGAIGFASAAAYNAGRVFAKR
jgi:hypothetical protein